MFKFLKGTVNARMLPNCLKMQGFMGPLLIKERYCFHKLNSNASQTSHHCLEVNGRSNEVPSQLKLRENKAFCVVRRKKKSIYTYKWSCCDCFLVGMQGYRSTRYRSWISSITVKVYFTSKYCSLQYFSLSALLQITPQKLFSVPQQLSETYKNN